MSTGGFRETEAWLHSRMAEGAVAVDSSNCAAAAPGNVPRVNKLSVSMIGEVTGAFSGLAWDGGDEYWTHTDSAGAGPDAVVYLVRLKVTPAKAEILETIALRDEQGALVTGSMLDPEDIAVAPDGTFWLCDEIHPLFFQVSRDGQVLRRVNPPDRYKSRVSGRGFEGLTISPDGRTLYIILQTGLSTEADKTHTWLLAYDLETESFTEYPYYLDAPSAYNYPAGVKPWIGANGLVMVTPSDLLVIERDNLSGENARQKRIYWVTIPAEPTGEPLAKRLVADLKAQGYSQEKLEGFTLPNPNTMLVMNDNDGDPAKPTEIWYMQW